MSSLKLFFAHKLSDGRWIAVESEESSDPSYKPDGFVLRVERCKPPNAAFCSVNTSYYIYDLETDRIHIGLGCEDEPWTFSLRSELEGKVYDKVYTKVQAAL